MSNFLHRFKYKTAVQQKRNKFDLSCNHITTQDFYQMSPIYIKEVMPNETVKINLRSQTRCAPMIQPLFGSVRTVNRAFFVPCRTIMDGFNDFITNTPTVHGLSTTGLIGFVPRVLTTTLIQVLVNSYSDEVTVSEKSDFQYGNKYYVLSKEGRHVFKILTSLGYKLNFATGDGEMVSCMPLLAFAKIWVDWFANPQYDTRSEIEKYFVHTQTPFDTAEIGNILSTVRSVCYSADYFTQAWDNPTSPNGTTNQLEQVINITDPSQSKANLGSGSVVNNNIQGMSNTPVIRGADDTGVPQDEPMNISQYILNTLHAVTDFVTRHRMVGSRALDRYMAEFGIQLSSEKLNRSVYIGKSNGEFMIGDVTQTTPDIENGSSNPFGVGNYTGKMLGHCNGSFDYTSDEFGYIVICSYIEPLNNYVYGRPRMLFHLSKLDFFNGDFDNLGTQPVRVDEVYCGNTHSFYGQNSYKANNIFGFQPRYSEYKVAFDNLSGDFLLASKNENLDGWLLKRRTKPENASMSGFKHNNAFCIASDEDYLDIWQDQTNTADHFFTVFRFDVDSFMPCKTLFDMYDYANEDGKDMVGTVNGTQITD